MFQSRNVCLLFFFKLKTSNVHLPGRDHEVRREEGSHPGEQLAVIDHRVPEVLPHNNVCLHHEGTINRKKTAHTGLVLILIAIIGHMRH